MKVLSSPSYEVEEALHAKLAEKYASFMPEFTEFKVGPSKVRVDKRIMDGLVHKPRQQAGFNLSVLWVRLLKICGRLRIPAVFVNIAVVLDEAVTLPLHVNFEDEGEGALWGYIFIPPSQLKSPVTHFAFVLLHELCHCLLNIPEPKSPKEIYDYELLADVLSMAALRQVVPPHTRRYREAVRSLSYVAAEEMKETIGPKVQRDILRDPLAFLRQMVTAAQGQPEGQGRTMTAEERSDHE